MISKLWLMYEDDAWHEAFGFGVFHLRNRIERRVVRQNAKAIFHPPRNVSGTDPRAAPTPDHGAISSILPPIAIHGPPRYDH